MTAIKFWHHNLGLKIVPPKKKGEKVALALKKEQGRCGTRDGAWVPTAMSHATPQHKWNNHLP